MQQETDNTGRPPAPPAIIVTSEETAPLVVATLRHEFAHEALLKEMHKADDLAETHSVLVVTISGAAFAFAATQLENPIVVYCVAVFGIAVAIEWFFKIIRHTQIFDEARRRLAIKDRELGIDTVRPPPRYASGFKILRRLSYLFIAGWIIFVALIYLHTIRAETPTVSDVFDRSTKQLARVTGIQNSKWKLISMTWDDRDHAYNLILSPDLSSAEKWIVTYDTEHKRIITCNRQ